MKQFYVFLFSFLMLGVSTNTLDAQKSIGIHFSIGPQFDFWEFHGDVSDLTTNPSLSSANIRLRFERTIREKIRLSIGYDANSHGFATPLQASLFIFGTTSVFYASHIPIKVHYRFLEFGENDVKFRVWGQVGYQLGINHGYGSFSGSSSSLPNGTSIQMTFRNNQAPIFHLLEAGIRLELQFFQHWALTCNAHLAESFTEMLVSGRINYTINNVSKGADFFSQGSYAAFSLGTRYQF